MREQTERKHVIDFLFPLALFFVLTATSVALVVLASGTYSHQVQDSEDSFVSRTALSYVTEKIHQADEYGSVYAGTFDGQDAIVICQTYSEQTYMRPTSMNMMATCGSFLFRMASMQKPPMDAGFSHRTVFPLKNLRKDCSICIVQTKTAVFPIPMSVSKVRRNT